MTDAIVDVDVEDEEEDEVLVSLGVVQASVFEADKAITAKFYSDFKSQMKDPPFAQEHEREVVANILVYGVAALRVVEELGLTAAHFYKQQLAVLFRAAQSVVGRGEAIGNATIYDAILRAGEVDDVYSVSWVESTASCFAIPPHMTSLLNAHLASGAAAIIEKARLRAILDITRRTAAMAWTGRKRAEEIIAEATRDLHAADAHGSTELPDNSALIRAVRATMPAVGGKRVVVPTGLQAVDAHFAGGVEPGDLVIVAARPSMGKTQFALDWAGHLALEKRERVLIFSLEMTGPQLLARMAAARADVDTRRSNVSAVERHRVEEQLESLQMSPIRIDDRVGMSISHIVAGARRESRRGPLGLVIVDYLQLVLMDGDARRDELVGDVTRGLKMLARELRCPVVALSQLNRSVESRPNKRPLMSDLRESGNIEQDADVIGFLFREEYYERERTPEDKVGVCEFIVSKFRNGEAGRAVKLRFAGKGTPRFSNLSEETPFGDSRKRRAAKTHHDEESE